MNEKIPWSGRLTSVQPHIRLLRSFDERDHRLLGYVLVLEGIVGDEARDFSVAVGKTTPQTHDLRVGAVLAGRSARVKDTRLQTAEFDMTSGLKVVEPAPGSSPTPPPWVGVPPPIEVYRERGHRRLAARTYASKCASCIWGCKMPVEMTIDHWNPRQKRYRAETFCFGPLSCRFYKAGPTRKVPGRKGMSYEEEDWVDEDDVSHRGPDE